MNFRAEIDIMPLDELLDPQGKVVNNAMHNLGLNSVSKVRIGKHILLELQAENEEEATKLVETACKQILANLIMEKYSYRIEAVK